MMERNTENTFQKLLSINKFDAHVISFNLFEKESLYRLDLKYRKARYMVS